MFTRVSGSATLVNFSMTFCHFSLIKCKWVGSHAKYGVVESLNRMTLHPHSSFKMKYSSLGEVVSFFFWFFEFFVYGDVFGEKII